MKQKKKQQIFKNVLIGLFIALLVPVLLGVKWTTLDGVSMEPTFRSGAIAIQMDAWGIKEGDVVLFKTPEWEKWPEGDDIQCKRIGHIKGDNEFWLLGDNEDKSYDSRQYGYINRTNIYKKVLFVIQWG